MCHDVCGTVASAPSQVTHYLPRSTVILSGAKGPRAKRSAACCRIGRRDGEFALRTAAPPGDSSHTLRMTS